MTQNQIEIHALTRATLFASLLVIVALFIKIPPNVEFVTPLYIILIFFCSFKVSLWMGISYTALDCIIIRELNPIYSLITIFIYGTLFLIVIGFKYGYLLKKQPRKYGIECAVLTGIGICSVFYTTFIWNLYSLYVLHIKNIFTLYIKGLDLFDVYHSISVAASVFFFYFLFLQLKKPILRRKHEIIFFDGFNEA